MQRLIIHTDNMPENGLLRIYNNLPEYWRLKPPKDNRRLTICFDVRGVMAIYHTLKDLVIFAPREGG